MLAYLKENNWIKDKVTWPTFFLFYMLCMYTNTNTINVTKVNRKVFWLFHNFRSKYPLQSFVKYVSTLIMVILTDLYEKKTIRRVER